MCGKIYQKKLLKHSVPIIFTFYFSKFKHNRVEINIIGDTNKVNNEQSTD